MSQFPPRVVVRELVDARRQRQGRNHRARQHDDIDVRAWPCGDGTGVANPDGILATLPIDCHGVSVANLSGNGIVDLFTGCYWIKFDPNTNKSQVIKLCPGDPESDWTQPTICDVDNDGKADILFGLSDGRLFIYNTHLAYKPELMQWPTANHDFQHRLLETAGQAVVQFWCVGSSSHFACFSTVLPVPSQTLAKDRCRRRQR